MRRFYATLAIAALLGAVSLVPANAAPPTVTPSPGYDARLREQRAAQTQPMPEAVAPASKPVPRQRVKRIHDGAH